METLRIPQSINTDITENCYFFYEIVYRKIQESDINKAYSNFKERVKKEFEGNKTVSEILQTLVPEMFDFKKKYVKYIQLNQLISEYINADFSENIQRIFYHTTDRYSILFENIKFALRTHHRYIVKSELVKQVVGIVDNNKDQSFEALELLMGIDYKTFMLIIVSTGLPVANDLKQMFDSVLKLELLTLLSVIIQNESIEIKDITLNELSDLSADIGQDIGALSFKLGFRNHKKPLRQNVTYIENTEDVFFSEIGISEYNQTILAYENN